MLHTARRLAFVAAVAVETRDAGQLSWPCCSLPQKALCCSAAAAYHWQHRCWVSEWMPCKLQQQEQLLNEEDQERHLQPPVPGAEHIEYGRQPQAGEGLAGHCLQEVFLAIQGKSKPHRWRRSGLKSLLMVFVTPISSSPGLIAPIILPCTMRAIMATWALAAFTAAAGAHTALKAAALQPGAGFLHNGSDYGLERHVGFLYQVAGWLVLHIAVLWLLLRYRASSKLLCPCQYC